MDFFHSKIIQQLVNFLGDSPRKSLTKRISVKHSKRISERRITRASTLLQRRNIEVMEPESSFIKPAPSKTMAKEKKHSRLSLLKKWKAEKEERMKKEKTFKKPTFVVGAPSNLGFPSVSTIPKKSKDTSKLGESSFAPRLHQFKPPSNVKPMSMKPPPSISKKDFQSHLNISAKPPLNISKKGIQSQLNIGAKPPPHISKKDVQSRLNTSAKPAEPFKRVTRSQKASPHRSLPAATRGPQQKKVPPVKSSNISIKSSTVSKSVTSKTKDTAGTAVTRTITNKKAKLNLKIKENSDTIEEIDTTTTTMIVSTVKKSSPRNKKVVNNTAAENKESHSSSSLNISTIKKSASRNKEEIKTTVAENKESHSLSSLNISKVKKSTPKNKEITKNTVAENKESDSLMSSNISIVKKNTPKDKKGIKNTAPKNIEPDLLITFSPSPPKDQSTMKETTTESIGSDTLTPLNSANNKSVHKTPENVNTQTTYISPFVTLTRGKGSVKKENKRREELGLPPHMCHDLTGNEEKSRTTGSAYFTKLLENEISSLNAEIKQWNNYKENNEVSEDAIDMINVAIGQANLLINKKFQQFRGLVDACRDGIGEKPVTVSDLQGFWDMMYMQVENLDKRFQNLENMKKNNWEEIKPEVKKTEVVKKVTKVTRKPAAKNVRSSNLRAAIQAARSKKNLQNNDNNLLNPTDTVFDGGFFTVRSPNKSHSKTPSQKRKSLLNKVLSAETKKRISNTSPSIAIIKASSNAKTIQSSAQTPGKSILKSTNAKGQCSSKAVIFQDEISSPEKHIENTTPVNCSRKLNFQNENIEMNTPNLQMRNKTPLRRSKRLSSICSNTDTASDSPLTTSRTRRRSVRL